MSVNSAGEYLAHVAAESTLRHRIVRSMRWAPLGGAVAGIGMLLPGLWSMLVVAVGLAGALYVVLALMNWAGTDPYLRERHGLHIAAAILVTNIVVWIAAASGAAFVALLVLGAAW